MPVRFSQPGIISTIIEMSSCSGVACGGAVETGRACSTSYQSGLTAGKPRWICRSNTVRDERIEELEMGVIALGVVYAASWVALIAWAAI